VERVGLQVQHGEPDPHCREDLDKGQSPVGEHHPESLEEHLEGADGEREGGEPAARAAQTQDGLLHLRLVALADGVDQFAAAGYQDDTTRIGENLVR
jgi:hypothetical protein